MKHIIDVYCTSNNSLEVCINMDLQALLIKELKKFQNIENTEYSVNLIKSSLNSIIFAWMRGDYCE